MKKKEIAEILKYTSPNHLYIITLNDILIKLECPFEVVVLIVVGDLELGKIVLVEKVKVTYELITVFQINGKLYFYYYFDFVLSF